MTTAERCPTRTPLRSTQRVAIAGFLVGYTSNTHASRTTDLRIFARWCRDNRLMLLAVRRVHLELFARWMESEHRMPSTVARRLSTLPASTATATPRALCLDRPQVSWRIFPARSSARGGIRTHTTSRSEGFKPPASASSATRAWHQRYAGARKSATVSPCSHSSSSRRDQAASDRALPPTSTEMARHRSARSRSAWGEVRQLAMITPSIMSASTAGHGRPRTRTAITAPPGRRRMVRSTPTNRGGHRKPGATSRRRRASRPSSRAAWAN